MSPDKFATIQALFAFIAIMASLGIGGVAFGFGVLPAPQTVVTELPPINVTSVSNPILV